MNTIYKILIITAFVAVGLPSSASHNNQSEENIFYYLPSEKAYQSVEENYRDIDILAPQIYNLLPNNQVIRVGGTDILELAEEKNMQVMPLVINMNSDKALLTSFFNDEDAQEEFIDYLIDEAKDHDFIGWQLDFENISHLDRDRYVDFVKDVYREFQKKDLLLSVAIIPGTADYNKDALYQDWSSGYNVGELAKVSDFISIMTYDDPRSLGPVASMPYVKRALNQTLKDVPSEKISLGIPFYCWQYVLGNPKKIASVRYDIAADTMTKYKEHGVGSLYLDEWKAEIFVFNKPGVGLNYIWCDNVESFKAKKELAKNEGLRGISAWALGQEDNRIWDEL